MYEVYGIGDSQPPNKLLEKFGTADKVFSATAEKIAKFLVFQKAVQERLGKSWMSTPKSMVKNIGIKNAKSIYLSNSRNPSYTYSSESFEENSS